MNWRLTICLLLLTGTLWAENQAAAPARVETRTRLVALFSDLNQQLFQAIESHNTEAFRKLVAEDFELCYATAPDRPLTREDWMQSRTRGGVKSFQISQMAVRGWNEVAVVSFLLEENSATPASTRNFVVQAWSRDGDTWKLQNAYISRVGSAVRASTGKDKRPTGRD